MRYSKIYVPTVKDVVPDSEALNYRLLYKAGFVRRNSAGIFSFLPFGYRVLERLKDLVDSKMEMLNCHEMHLPHSVSKEDMMQSILSSKLSYRELPIGAWFVREKASEGIRPRLGLLQSKSWRVVEGFKFVEDMTSLKDEGKIAADAYRAFLHELGIAYLEAERLSWDCIGETDRVFLLPYANGEDIIASCSCCGKYYMADSMPSGRIEQEQEAEAELSLVYTPQVKTIGEVAAYLGVEASQIVKTLVYNADGKLYGVLIRGDRELSEVKLKSLLKCRSLRPATEKEVFEATKAEIGFAGPIGLDAEILCDNEAAAMKNVVVGANKTDHHYVNAVVGRDFEASRTSDLRSCTAADKCLDCDGDIEFSKGFVLGTIRKRDGGYMERPGFSFTSRQDAISPIYILDVELNLYRLLVAIVEKHNDASGLTMPAQLAPYQVVVMAVHGDNEAQTAAAEQIYQTLIGLNYSVLLDDRMERVSVKFKDSELTGIPLRITVGRKIGEGIVELKYRNRETQEVHVNELIDLMLKNEVGYAESIQ